MTRRRLAAAAALVLLPATVGLSIAAAVQEFPRGLVVLACVLAALALFWHGARRRGRVRIAALALGVLLLAAGVVTFLILTDRLLHDALIVVGFIFGVASARAAFTTRVALPHAHAPKHAVLFFNPKSGGGKAERFSLADEARARGIDAVELRRGDDLERLAREAVDRGADALAMAGGDGSQAVIAAIAAENDLPYTCIPAGTRNHFALDLGVDRGDVVGALDAFIAGGERRVDLAEVNGRVFVNNVSLGLYAEAVQRDEYRDAKLRTLLDTLPDVLGATGHGNHLRWTDPSGETIHSDAAILVSNNPYRLGRPVGSGTRPRVDGGELGIVALQPPAGGLSLQPVLHEFSARSFEVEADGPVPAGIDGEAATLEPPLRFEIRPRVLRVRVAHAHPGASPSAIAPDNAWHAMRSLVWIAAGRAEQPSSLIGRAPSRYPPAR